MDQKQKQLTRPGPKKQDTKRTSKPRAGASTPLGGLAVPLRSRRTASAVAKVNIEDKEALKEATWGSDDSPIGGGSSHSPIVPERGFASPAGAEGSWHSASPMTGFERTQVGEAPESVRIPPPVVTISREGSVGPMGGFTSCTATGHMARRVSLREDIEAGPLSVAATPSIHSDGNATDASGSGAVSGTRAAPSSGERVSSARFSLGGGINDAPAQANRAMMEAKDALESRSAGNIKREIRETVVESVSLLHSLVLRLADSRSRAIIEVARVKEQGSRDLGAQEVRHSRTLESTARTFEGLSSRIDKVDGDTEAVRSIIVHDVMHMMGDLKAGMADMAAEIKRLSQQLEAHPAPGACPPDCQADLRRELCAIKHDVATLRSSRCPSPEELARNMVPHLSALIPDARPDGEPGLRVTADIVENLQQLVADVHKGVLPSAPTSDRVDDLETAVRDIGAQVMTLADRTAEMGESIAPLRTNVEELRREVRATAELMTEASGPTRAAIEQLRGELKDRTLQGGRPGERVADLTPADRGTPVLEKRRNSREPGRLATRPRFGLRLASGVPGKTSQELIDLVKTEVDVATLGIAVNQVRKTKGQGVVVTCDSEDDREALSRAIRGSNTNILATPLKNRRPQIRLVGVANDLNDAQIPAALVNQNKKIIPEVDPGDIKVLRRTRGRNSSLFNVVLEVAPRVWANLKGRSVHLGYQIVPALDQSPMVQCFNCMGFGHTARECRGDTTCGYCSSDHETRSCPNRNGGPVCCHCTRDGNTSHHPAYSAECPNWQRWDRIARLSVSYC